MMTNIQKSLLIAIAASNAVVAASFIYSFLFVEKFTELPMRSAPENAVGVAFSLFLWVALQAIAAFFVIYEDLK